MGEVLAHVELENFVDRTKAEAGELPESEVRCFETLALADTAAVMNMLPRDIVEHLGVPIKSTAIVTLADERREEMPVAQGVTMKIGQRSSTLPCLVGPPRSEPLIGQVALGVLDLLVDYPGKRLIPNPESPIYPSLKLK